MSYNKIVIERKIREFLQEDCSFLDVSSLYIPPKTIVSAKIIAKSDGVISGLEELNILFNILNVSINLLKKDGESFKKGDIIVELSGNARDILIGERVGLNLVTHMSSITTTTRKFIEIIKKSKKKVKIASTRKTLPGLRIFEKKAVSLAGELSDPHRFSLDDMILLKDTHLRFYNGNVEKLLKEVKKRASFTKKIDIEIEKIEDVLVAAQNGADIIMLDNMSPDHVNQAINILKNNGLRKNIVIEISGGITENNIKDYLTLEPDVISTGLITQHPSERIDLSLRFD